jgi:hypothetical protein
MRAIFSPSLASLPIKLLKCWLAFFVSATLAVDFTVPLPSQSTLAPYQLEMGLRTTNAELLFLRWARFGSPFSSAFGFVGIDAQTSGFLSAVQPWPARSFGDVKVLTTRDGGFVRVTTPISIGFLQPPQSTILQKFDAQGHWQATRSLAVIGGAFDLTEAQDSKIVVVFRDPKPDNLFGSQTRTVDMYAPHGTPSVANYFAQLCPESVLSTTCQLSASVPHNKSRYAIGASTLVLGRRIQTSFESNRWSLLRLSLTGKVLRTVELGSLPSAKSMQFSRNPTGTLVQVLDQQQHIAEFRFFTEDDDELWRISTQRLPTLYSGTFAQADATGVTLFATSNQSILRLRGSGQLLWQTAPTPTLGPIFDAHLGLDGSAIFSTNLSNDYLQERWRWIRADGSEVALPAATTSLCFADGGGAYGLVQAPVPLRSDMPPRQTLWRFNAQGLVQTQSTVPNLTVVPEAMQVRPNALGGIDLAATYANQANASIARIDAGGAVQTRIEVPIRGQLHMVSFDQLFVGTPENTLARVANNGAVLWDRALFPEAGFGFLPISDGLALVSNTTLRTLDLQGNIASSLNLPASNAWLECYRTDVRLSGDQQRCLFRAQESSPLEIYGINSALQIQLRHVLFRAGAVLSVAADGDLLMPVSPPNQPVELARFSGSGQLRWRSQLQSEYPQVFASASGGAWVLANSAEESTAISYIDSVGVSRIASVLRQPVLGVALLSDSSLLIANLNAVVRFQPTNGGIRISTKSFAANRVFNSDLSAEDMRATWRERSNDGGNGAFVSVFDWFLR